MAWPPKAAAALRGKLLKERTTIALYIDQIVQFAGGLCCTVAAYNGRAEDAVTRRRLPSWLPGFLKIAGLLLMAYAIAMAAYRYFSANSGIHRLSPRRIRAVSRLRRGVPPAQEMLRQIDFDNFLKFGGRYGRIGTARHAANILNYLNRRNDQSPGKSPPTQYQGEDQGFSLLPRRALSATEVHLRFPRCQHKDGPNAMRFVYIYRSGSAAFRAIAAVHFLDVPHYKFIGKLAGEPQIAAAAAALQVAKPPSVIPYSSEPYPRSAICACAHLIAPVACLRAVR